MKAISHRAVETLHGGAGISEAGVCVNTGFEVLCASSTLREVFFTP